MPVRLLIGRARELRLDIVCAHVRCLAYVIAWSDAV